MTSSSCVLFICRMREMPSVRSLGRVNEMTCGKARSPALVRVGLSGLAGLSSQVQFVSYPSLSMSCCGSSAPGGAAWCFISGHRGLQQGLGGQGGSATVSVQNRMRFIDWPATSPTSSGQTRGKDEEKYPCPDLFLCLSSPPLHPLHPALSWACNCVSGSVGSRSGKGRE